MSLNMIIPVRPGSVVALVTPMTESNAIDYVKLESLLKWHIAEGLVSSNTFQMNLNPSQDSPATNHKIF